MASTPHIQPAEPWIDSTLEQGREKISSEESTIVPSSSSEKIAWYGYIWDSWALDREERNFVAKLDLSLLLFSVLGLIMRYVDQTNLSNAYLSGLKEDLNMYGNQLNTAQALWSVGYVIGQVPSTMLLNRVSPHYLIFALEFGWSFLTLCTMWVKTYNQLYVIRFFVGLFESGYYPGLLFLIGSWYKKEELAKRSNIFQASTATGTLISGLLQGGIYSTLNGKNGIEGWRWMFCISAVISLPVAICAFFFIPDLPTLIKPNWLFNERDIAIGKARMAAAGRDGPRKGSFTPKFFLSLLREWHIWASLVFTATYSFYIFAQNPQQSFGFYLKAAKYPVTAINYYPCGIWSIQIFSALTFSWLSDTLLRGRRWPPLVLVAVWHMVDCAALAGTPVYESRSVRWTLYYLTGIVNCTPGLLYAWCSEIMGRQSEKRAIVMGTFNCVAFSFNAWLPLLLFKATEQPRVLKGTIAASVASGLQAGGILLILYLSTRDKKREAAHGEEVDVVQVDGKD